MEEQTAIRTWSMSKRTAAWIAVAVAGAGAIYYVAMTAPPSSAGYAYRLLCPFICAGLLAAEELLERASGTDTGDGLGAFIKLFALACIVGGKAFALYAKIPYYDKLLHTVSGVLFTLVGARIYSLSRPECSAIAAAGAGILAALASGYLWELYEFAGDMFFGLNSQNWADGVAAYLPDAGGWLVTDPHGTGLIDTMTDMIVNFIGSLAAAASYAALHRRRI